MNRKPRLMAVMPEIIFDLDPGIGNLPSIGINFQNGGMAPVTSKDVISLQDEGTFEVYAVTPKWESSLRELNKLSARETKLLDSTLRNDMRNNFFLISHPSFNRVRIEGSNTMMYEDSWRFSSIDRAIALSAGVTNTLLNYIKPDMVWLNDWMTGPVAPVAKALGIKVITTGHNIFTKTAPLDYLIHRGIELRDSDDYTPMKWVWKNNDQFDFMASAINPADDFLTVSEGFLERLLKGDIDYLAPSVTDAIKKKSYSKHADGRSRVHGYLNPLERDKSTFLESVKNYGLEETIDWRKKNGEELRQMVGLKAGGRLVVFPNRAYSQKNPKLVIDNAIRLARNHDLRILFLCNGDSNVINNMKEVALGSNGYVAYQSFDKKIEKKVKGSDNTYGLMTSEFEPCGGPNLNYPLEGILIGAHSIDGLKDTVKSINVTNNTGNGFPYNDNNSGGLDYCISEMIKFANLDDNTRYGHLIRIANEHLTKYASAPRMKRLVEEIFLPLYHEKYKKM